MSGDLLKYSGLVTKTRAMCGRLLGEEELSGLSDYEAVEDFIAFLRESKSYAPMYRSHDEIQHRAQVEAVIDGSLYADYQKLYQFADSRQRKGLEIIFFRYEVNILKECLEYASKSGGENDLGYLSLFFDRHACYDREATAGAASMQELMNALSGTHYEKLFYSMQEDADLDYADYTSQLDVYYYKSAWKRKDRLGDKTMRRIFTEILGTEIDWLNILWMYRSKIFFYMKPEVIRANMIPVNHRLKRTELNRLLETEEMEAFIEILAETSYFKDKDAVVQLGDEITYRRIMDKTYEKLCQKYRMSIAPVLKYLYDKENEIEILTTILEGIRYQMPPKEIRDLAIVTTAPGK